MTARRQIVVTVALWLVLAGTVWNVIFDRMVVLAGRRYVYDATLRYRSSGTYLRIDDVMRPAVAHGAWTATAWAAGIAVAGLALIRLAAARDARVRRDDQRRTASQ
jgi:hypothetical protein